MEPINSIKNKLNINEVGFLSNSKHTLNNNNINK